MEDLFNNLSNLELRNRLISNGIYPGPVTDSTRKLYIAKLLQFENNNSPINTPPSSGNYRNHNSFVHFERNPKKIYSSTPETNGDDLIQKDKLEPSPIRRSPRKIINSKPNSPSHEPIKYISIETTGVGKKDLSESITNTPQLFYSPTRASEKVKASEQKALSVPISAKLLNIFRSYLRPIFKTAEVSESFSNSAKSHYTHSSISNMSFFSRIQFLTILTYLKTIGIRLVYFSLFVLTAFWIYPFVFLSIKSLSIVFDFALLISIIIGAFVAVLLLFVYVYRRYKKHSNEHSEEVYGVVQEIIKMAIKQLEDYEQGSSSSPYLAVPHIRDILFEPANRTKKASIWNDAVSFIEKFESRIRAENKIISGQEFRVWKWIGTTKLLSKSTPIKKEEKEENIVLEDRANNLSPCLKIYILDQLQGEILPTIDALSVKIKSLGVHILHFHHPNASSKLVVYTKLANTNEAIKVYRSLNTTSINGRFIKVKFVKLRQYEKRFPQIA